MIYLLLYLDGQKWYFEADDEGVVYRQMLLEEGKASRISNVKKYYFFLADHELSLDDPELEPIPKAIFEAVWNELIKEQLPDWLETKRTFPRGTKVIGYLEVLYPHGVIVSIPDTKALGLADYDECAAHAGHRNIHKGLLVEATVSGYDEVNCWLLLEEPRVWGFREESSMTDQSAASKELALLYRTLHRSFPYQDSVRLKEDFAEAFAHLKEGWFDGDFSEYCALIAGTVSYVIHNSVTEIPQRQLALLQKSFFERYPAYAFIQTRLSDYPTISADLEDHERARGMLLSLIHDIDGGA